MRFAKIAKTLFSPSVVAPSHAGWIYLSRLLNSCCFHSSLNEVIAQAGFCPSSSAVPRHEGKVWIAVSDPYDIKEGSASITEALCETSQGVFELEIMQSYSKFKSMELEMFFLLCCRNSAWKENRGNLILLAILRINKAVNRTALSLYCNSRLIQLFSDFLGTLQGTTVFRGPCNDPNSYLTGSGFEWVLASWLIRRAARQTCLLHSERSQLFHDRWMRWVTVM